MGGKRTRHARGSVVMEKRASGDHVWYFRWTDENGKRPGVQFALVKDFRTRSLAWGEAERLRLREKYIGPAEKAKHGRKTFGQLVEQYRKEEMPQRFSTKHGYESWLDKHIVPQWAQGHIEDAEPALVEQWLKSLDLAPKSKGHIKSLMSTLFDFAMKLKWIQVGRNPMELVTVKGGTKRKRRPKVLTPDQLRLLVSNIEDEYVRVAETLSMCLGLLWSEVLGIQWGDIDWVKLSIKIQRAVVQGHEGPVKTEYRDAVIPIDPALAEVLLDWRRKSQFVGDSDWAFASPFKCGRQPYFPTAMRRKVHAAARKSGLEDLLKNEPTKILRNSYRAWLGETDAPAATIKDLMRHADIRTTFNVYGNGLEEPMRKANSKVVSMVLKTEAR